LIAQFELGQPDWGREELEQLPEYFPDIQGRMHAVIWFSHLILSSGPAGRMPWVFLKRYPDA
jgi:hypothetical protein